MSVRVAIIILLITITSVTGADPDKKAIRKHPNAIPGRYIVAFDMEAAGATPPAVIARELASTHGGQVVHTYGEAIAGMAIKLPRAAAEKILLDPRVAEIEEDGPIWLTAVQGPPLSNGLDRIDQDALPLSNSYTYHYTGYNTTIYIIDTGIMAHKDYEGRLIGARNFWTNHGTLNDPNRTEDCARHGSGVAAVAAGTKYGAAKSAKLFSVKVFGCSVGDSSVSDFIAGVNWIAAEKRRDPSRKMVASMSLLATEDMLLDDAVIGLISAGVTTIVSAGNGNEDACDFSPARLGNPNSYAVNPNGHSTITVAASNPLNDVRAPFSNSGACIDVFAPGMNMLTANPHEGYTEEAGAEGTSYASPLVAGVAALHLEREPSMTPAQVESRIKGYATRDKITDPKGSPNLLLHSFYRKTRACCSF
jgi:subtilisin family serine protease